MENTLIQALGQLLQSSVFLLIQVVHGSKYGKTEQKGGKYAILINFL